MIDTRKQKAEKASEMPIKHSLLVGNMQIGQYPSCQSSINHNRSMPGDLKLSQIGYSPLPPPFRGLHSPGVRKRCQIIFACYFWKSSIGENSGRSNVFSLQAWSSQVKMQLCLLHFDSKGFQGALKGRLSLLGILPFPFLRSRFIPVYFFRSSFNTK